MPSIAASEPPSVSLSFANNFWGKEDAGVSPLLERMHSAKVTGEELKSFYTIRAQIEEEYARKLLNLARKPLGSSETGTLRMSLDVVRGELESMGKSHQNVAGQMKSELEEPLNAFAGGMKERRKIVQTGIEKLLKTKNAQTATVNKGRDRYEQDCLKIKGYLAQGHMVMGQEERKNKAKLEKTQIQLSSTSNEYEAAVKVLEETTGRWNREWKAGCDKFQDLEEERLDYMKSSLWSFANIASTVCVSDDAACEKIRLSLEDCDVEKDITNFIKDQGTGQEIPDPPKYINFCRGDINDTSSEPGDEDGNYSVAQFQRTMNPTFRTSSPQPSTYESHHDPDSNLAHDLGLPKGRTSLQGDDAFTTPGAQLSAIPAPLAQAQPLASLKSYVDAPQIPHNPYPADGMTQLCRPNIGAPSERSSVPSPTRPESRDSQSDYSNPTSFSSVDPASGHVSPTKQYNSSNVSSASEDKHVQKKKSGFFQSHSPFKGRSNMGKEALQPQSASVTPSTRNTWAPATVRGTEGANNSPTRPFGHSRTNTFGAKQASPSPDPDPIHPRTNFQLNIGNNVFDVASPDFRNKPLPIKKEAPKELDPIAQALAELKGVTKQSSVRQSADRHYGMATPAPPGTPGGDRGVPAGGVPTPFANSSMRASPPPSYDQPPMSRLGAPQPAHTSKAMQQTTAQYVNQKRDMFNPGSRQSTYDRSHSQQRASRPGTGGGQMPRATSPAPIRSASPRPFTGPDQLQQSYRNPSADPYAQHQGAARPRAQSSSPQKHSGYGGYVSHGGSPGYQGPRAASPNPNPGYGRPNGMPRAASPQPFRGGSSMNSGSSRPSSSRGSDQAGGGAMALQLASAPANDVYGVQRPAGRPQSQYYGGSNDGGYGSGERGVTTRTRSQSAGTQRQVTRSGQPILHYAKAMYMYQAAIAEELTFAKGDVLAVTRLQDDGWWEAEVCGKNSRPGLVPSNYLKQC